MDDQPPPESVLVCGDCVHWEPNAVDPAPQPVIVGREPEPRRGTCWRNPPKVFLAQQPNALEQMQLGFLTARPQLLETERACGEFDYKDAPVFERTLLEPIGDDN